MSRKFQVKRGAKANLPILENGEFGLCTDTKELFIGSDGQNIQLAKQEQIAIDKKDQPTTSGQSWSTTNQVRSFTNNGSKFVIHGSPNFFRRKVMIFGSSVAYGSGATGNNGWGNRLKALLESRGYIVKNHSIGGNTTKNLIDRFYSDIVPESPDYVIIGLSLANEGIVGPDPESVYQQYVTNMQKLIRMIRQHDIIPIIAGPYPNNGYNATHYRYIRQLQAELESWSVAVFDFLGATDDLTGKWLTGSWADAGHPNDIGHEEMFRAIPPSIFDRLINWNDGIKNQEPGAVKLGNDSTKDRPLEFVPKDPIRSFTFAFWVRNADGVIGKAFCGVGDGQSRVRNPSGPYQYTSVTGTEITSTVNGHLDLKWHHIAITHNTIEGKTRFYIDGVKIGEVEETFSSISRFSLGGRADSASAWANAVGCEYKDAVVYRTRLNDEQVKALASGKILKASLELYAPLSDKTIEQGSRLINLAPTDAYFKVNTPDLTPLERSVLSADVVAQEIDLPGGKLYTKGSSLIFRKNDGTETTLVR